MVKVSLSEFKAKMSYYLRLVKSGEELELQERGFRILTHDAQLGKAAAALGFRA